MKLDSAYKEIFLAIEEENYSHAFFLAQQVIAENKEDPSLFLTLANIYTLMHLPEDAFKTLTTLMHQFPDYAPAYHNIGVFYFRKNSWHQAIAAFKHAISKKPDYVDAYYHLGLVYYKLNQFQESESYFKAVLELTSSHVGAQFFLANIHLQFNRIDQAFQLLLHLYKQYPNHFPTQINLSHCYLAKGDFKNAEEMLLAAYNIVPNDTQVLFNLGVINYYQGKLEKAIHYYQLILQEIPDDLAARYNLAIICIELGLRSQAITHLEKLQFLSPNEAVDFLLSALKGETIPKIAPTSYVTNLFDQYAQYYDQHMNYLHNSVPEKLHMIFKQFIKETSLTLDLGAGTGKMGEILKQYTKELLGVDLSNAMLNIAQAKKCYTALYQSDILAFLPTLTPQSVDCVVAADCLEYFGELSQFFSLIANVLKPGGFFLFNVEKTTENNYLLQQSGRFAHSVTYIQNLAKETFHIIYQEEIILRNNKEPLAGFVFLLKCRKAIQI